MLITTIIILEILGAVMFVGWMSSDESAEHSFFSTVIVSLFWPIFAVLYLSVGIFQALRRAKC